MAAKEKEYQRLPGRGVRRGGIATATRARLWLAKDHILSVENEWYTQQYKRFYFRDIQAFIVRKTDGGKYANIVLGLLALLPMLAAIATSGGFMIFWWSVTAFFGLILLINVLYGTTCRTHIRTAVQTEELPSLRRLRRAHKVIARIHPFIVSAQGEMTAGEVQARMRESVTGGATSYASTEVVPQSSAPPVSNPAAEITPVSAPPPAEPPAN